MLLNTKIQELLALRDNEFVIKDEEGNYCKPATGLKGEIVQGKDVEREILKEIFGDNKVGSGQYRSFKKLFAIVEKNAPNAVVSRINREVLFASAQPKRKSTKDA